MSRRNTDWIEIYRWMFLPAIRFCVKRSLSYQQVQEIIKSLFVEVATEELKKENTRVSVSKITIRTGLHRRDVTRIYREEGPKEAYSSLAWRVANHWEQDPQFQTKSSKPRVLSVGDTESEFFQLVRAVSHELSPATILADMERIGLVTRTAKGVRLLGTEENLSEAPHEGLGLLAEDMETLASAVEQNLFEQRLPGNLHLRTEYDNIFKDDLSKIRDWMNKHGAEFHAKARKFFSRFDKDIHPGSRKEGGGKLVLSSFSWTENDS